MVDVGAAKSGPAAAPQLCISCSPIEPCVPLPAVNLGPESAYVIPIIGWTSGCEWLGSLCSPAPSNTVARACPVSFELSSVSSRNEMIESGDRAGLNRPNQAWSKVPFISPA